MNQILSQMPQWLQAAVLVLGVLSTIATVLSGLFAALATMFPSATFFTRAAGAVGTLGLDLQKVLAFLGGIVGKGGGKAMGLVLCIALATSTTGCAALKSWWGGGGEQQVLTLAEKIATEALEGKSIAQIAIDLGIGVAQVIEAILADPHLQGTAAQHEAVALRAGMAGVGCK